MAVLNFLAGLATGVVVTAAFVLFYGVWLGEERWRTPHRPFLAWLYRGAVGRGA